jgi:sugar phosphate isomerase/epimerase
MVRVAARIGYRGVGLRLIAVTDDSPGYPIMDDAVMMRETKAALADTGLRLSDIEFVKITPEINIPALESFIAAERRSALATSSRRPMTTTIRAFPTASLASRS